jgi:hypothetical protein
MTQRQMKILGLITILISISAFAIQPITLYHKNGKLAWNGITATHDNGTTAWNGFSASYSNGKYAWNGLNVTFENGKYAWNGLNAYYGNGKYAWNGLSIYHDNGKYALNGSIAYDEDGKPLVNNLLSYGNNIYLLDLPTNEIKLSSKVTLLTKKLNQKTYLVGFKVQLSEKILFTKNNETKTVENSINLGKDIKFVVNNARVLVKVLDQKVFPR